MKKSKEEKEKKGWKSHSKMESTTFYNALNFWIQKALLLMKHVIEKIAPFNFGSMSEPMRVRVNGSLRNFQICQKQLAKPICREFANEEQPMIP